jgi:hypothetical protein
MSAPRPSADPGPISARRGLATLVVAVTAATVLAGAGGSLPAPPLGGPAELEAWWQTAGTPGAVFGLLRIAGLTLSGYVALLGLLGAVAAITRWSWADALVSRSATAGMRRLLIGGGLAVGMSMSTVGAATSSTVFDLVDIGASTVEFELQDLGSVPSAPESLPTAPPRPDAVTPTVRSVPRPETVAATWTVVAGDHLWSIAARTVLARGGDDGEPAIAAYWLRLIDHNRDLVGDNPDLIHPGQMIRLPD